MEEERDRRAARARLPIGHLGIEYGKLGKLTSFRRRVLEYYHENDALEALERFPCRARLHPQDRALPGGGAHWQGESSGLVGRPATVPERKLRGFSPAQPASSLRSRLRDPSLGIRSGSGLAVKLGTRSFWPHPAPRFGHRPRIRPGPEPWGAQATPRSPDVGQARPESCRSHDENEMTASQFWLVSANH